MSVRIYLLLDIVNGNQACAAELLKSKPGVKLVDSLENSPDLIVVIEAPCKERLGEALMPVIDCIDGITHNLKVLIGEGNTRAPDFDTRPGVKAANNGGKRVAASCMQSGIDRSKKEMVHA
ncbi:MAG: hypothetical protein JXA01_07640 [Dehalococcoidia bacterium]|nr:hypothetical protein [Dehalococcoidia bacterium]